ncbi:hypothetical protein GOQ27_04730 [Clostridium sp. D2Q-11]|uniref:Uncharacterized protein n=1 Tax=Anaeromonas frigoriresistens TaxID=2683708 RepID=A0A942UVU9_9FIRM|nr:hypothetical protein [Anaeromonas frigoriresistens]MBS4537754.1 hypothetical protein [Anaeromonas frigoriresistens]
MFIAINDNLVGIIAVTDVDMAIGSDTDVAMLVSSVSVLTNTLKLKDFKPK